ncbi:DsbA family protein [Streptomyces sp. NBC_00669]|uniref:DsbA family protein n=1 Tax=Streptomyces sp. NBC_00669 TaxID=2976011 RepID=UPI002E34E133|nr:thioredoxin domain-containing protein [Streptomyces sp. NBC_00669]
MKKNAAGIIGAEAADEGARTRAVRVMRTPLTPFPARRRAALVATAVLALALPLAACSTGTDPGYGSHLPDSRTSAPATPSAPTATGTGAPADAGHAIPARLEADGTTITVGDPSAAHTLTVFEDPRCPICEQFEQANAAQVQALEVAGKIRVQYTFASFLDQRGGGGSKRTVNALRAALDASADGSGFAALHTLVYQYQPDEQTDGFTVDYLLQLAGRVPGLRSTTFDAAVRDQKYASFVSASENAFDKSGAAGTPMVKIDGDKVSDDSGIFKTADFKKMLADHGVS